MKRKIARTKMFVFETLMNIFEKVKFELGAFSGDGCALVARFPRPNDTFSSGR
jgi:hypothetical protein